MKTLSLSKTVERQIEINTELKTLKKEFDLMANPLKKELENIRVLEQKLSVGLDGEHIQIAESVLYVHGNPYGIINGGGTFVRDAIKDIASGCHKLATTYFGNKRYSGFYQRCDCSYGMGPKHGSVVDEVGLKEDARKRELTTKEKDACIYYLTNYQKIKEAIGQ